MINPHLKSSTRAFRFLDSAATKNDMNHQNIPTCKHFFISCKSLKEIHYGDMKNGLEVIIIHNLSLKNSFDSARYKKSREIPASIQERLSPLTRSTKNYRTNVTY